jgi:hypothetical protein
VLPYIIFILFLHYDGMFAYRVMSDDIYDATLNQTNVGNNNNKFYMIEVLDLSFKQIFVTCSICMGFLTVFKIEGSQMI